MLGSRGSKVRWKGASAFQIRTETNLTRRWIEQNMPESHTLRKMCIASNSSATNQLLKSPRPHGQCLQLPGFDSRLNKSRRLNRNFYCAAVPPPNLKEPWSALLEMSKASTSSTGVTRLAPSSSMFVDQHLIRKTSHAGSPLGIATTSDIQTIPGGQETNHRRRTRGAQALFLIGLTLLPVSHSVHADEGEDDDNDGNGESSPKQDAAQLHVIIDENNNGKRSTRPESIKSGQERVFGNGLDANVMEELTVVAKLEKSTTNGGTEHGSPVPLGAGVGRKVSSQTLGSTTQTSDHGDHFESADEGDDAVWSSRSSVIRSYRSSREMDHSALPTITDASSSSSSSSCPSSVSSSSSKFEPWSYRNLRREGSQLSLTLPTSKEQASLSIIQLVQQLRSTGTNVSRLTPLEMSPIPSKSMNGRSESGTAGGISASSIPAIFVPFTSSPYPISSSSASPSTPAHSVTDPEEEDILTISVPASPATSYQEQSDPGAYFDHAPLRSSLLSSSRADSPMRSVSLPGTPKLISSSSPRTPRGKPRVSSLPLGSEIPLEIEGSKSKFGSLFGRKNGPRKEKSLPGPLQTLDERPSLFRRKSTAKDSSRNGRGLDKSAIPPPVPSPRAFSTPSTPASPTFRSSGSRKPSRADLIACLPTSSISSPVLSRSSSMFLSSSSESGKPSVAHKTWKDTLTEKRYSTLLETYGRTELRRQEVIWELTETEISFVRSMEDICRVFADPLRDEEGSWIEGVPSPIARLLGWLEDIVQLHRTIAVSLSKLQSSQRPIVETVAPSLLVFVPQLEVYQPYLARFEYVTKIIDEALSDPTSQFGEFVRIQSSLAECGNMSLNSYLLKPVQRVMKYPLFFKQLWDLTPESHVDHIPTINLFNSTDFIIRAMQETKVREDEYEEIRILESQLRGVPDTFALARRDRRLLAQGPLRLIHIQAKDHLRLEAMRKPLRRTVSHEEQFPIADNVHIVRVSNGAEHSDLYDSDANEDLVMPLDEMKNERDTYNLSPPLAPFSRTKANRDDPRPSSMFSTLSNGSTASDDSNWNPAHSLVSSDRKHSSQTRSLKTKAKESTVHAYVFSDLMVLTVRDSENFSQRRTLTSGSRKGSVESQPSGTNCALLEDSGLVRISKVWNLSGSTGEKLNLRSTDEEKDLLTALYHNKEHDHLMALEVTPLRVVDDRSPSSIVRSSSPGPTKVLYVSVSVRGSGGQRSSMSSDTHARNQQRWSNAFEASAAASNPLSTAPLNAYTAPITQRERFERFLDGTVPTVDNSVRQRHSSARSPSRTGVQSVNLSDVKDEQAWWSARLKEIKNEILRKEKEEPSPLRIVKRPGRLIRSQSYSAKSSRDSKGKNYSSVDDMPKPPKSSSGSEPVVTGLVAGLALENVEFGTFEKGGKLFQ